MEENEKDKLFSSVFPDMEPAAEHLWNLAIAGKEADATAKETAARSVVACLLTAFDELDMTAIKGITFALRTFILEPNDGRDVWRECLGLPVRGSHLTKKNGQFYLDGREIGEGDRIHVLTGRGWRIGSFRDGRVWAGPSGERVGFADGYAMRWPVPSDEGSSDRQ